MTHQMISFVKSGIRIAGYVMIGVLGWKLAVISADPWLLLATVVLVISEVIGIVEEVGH